MRIKLFKIIFYIRDINYLCGKIRFVKLLYSLTCTYDVESKINKYITIYYYEYNEISRY